MTAASTTAVSQPPPGVSCDARPPARTEAPTETVPPRSPLERLVGAHQTGVWRYLRYLGADAAEADDLTQETFLSVATGDGRLNFEERGEPQTVGYLRTAARNQLLMLRRRQKRRVETVALEAAESVWAAAVGDGDGGGLLDALQTCVEKLAGRQRQAIDLHYRDGAGRQTIADRLGMKPDGVKTLLRRARQTLRECVERRLQADPS